MRRESDGRGYSISGCGYRDVGVVIEKWAWLSRNGRGYQEVGVAIQEVGVLFVNIDLIIIIIISEFRIILKVCSINSIIVHIMYKTTMG